MSRFSLKTVVHDRKWIHLIVETTMRYRQQMGKHYSPNIVAQATEAAMLAPDEGAMIEVLIKCLEDDEAKHTLQDAD